MNLLELRKSERELLAKELRGASSAEVANLARNIENALSRFSAIFPENEEQVYLFGLEINHLLKAANLERTSLGSLRDHLNPDVAFVFVCGLLGLNFRETRQRLEADRKRRREMADAEFNARQARVRQNETTLVKEIEELVSEKAASLLPPDIVPRR